ncbi:MAG: hypothetical protein QY323_01860 [Patescibacteria group bacterium]|nr:MAG: hypothetical protein QY323_01860 [Patescibacteria group bacterium]
MPVPKKDRNGFSLLDRGQRRKQRIPQGLEDPKPQPQPTEVPAVTVRRKLTAREMAARSLPLDGTSLSEPVALLNIPRTELGADLVLYLIAAYPDTSLLTSQLEYVRLGDIALIEKPETIAIPAQLPPLAEAPPIAWIPVRHASRMEKRDNGVLADTPIRIPNIPDSEGGRAVLDQIFNDYASREAYEYLLYTSENGFSPVYVLAAANRPPR